MITDIDAYLINLFNLGLRANDLGNLRIGISRDGCTYVISFVSHLALCTGCYRINLNCIDPPFWRQQPYNIHSDSCPLRGRTEAILKYMWEE